MSEFSLNGSFPNNTVNSVNYECCVWGEVHGCSTGNRAEVRECPHFFQGSLASNIKEAAQEYLTHV